MRLATVRVGRQDRIGVVHDDHLALVDAEVGPMHELIEHWDHWRRSLEVGSAFATAEAVWRPPVPRPGKVICVALNNSANKDRIISGPDHPAAFIKPSTSLLGHRQPIQLRSAYGRVHPEPELAVVIGSRCRDVSPEQATDHIFGYTVVNDLTSPTMRAEDTFHYRAIHPAGPGAAANEVRYQDTWVTYPGRYKGSDGFGPIGPWIVTRDEIDDPHSLPIRCLHGGRVVTEDNTRNLRFSAFEIISFLSGYMTLEPGDVVSLGTALKASSTGGAVQNVDLTALGGSIEVEIGRIGRLTNEVVVDG